MVQLIYSPLWFRGKDIVIDIFSVVVVLLIAFFSMKCYKLNKKNKNYFFLAISYLLIAASFFFKILTNFTVYTKIIEKKKFLIITLIYETVKPNYLLSFMSSILQKSLMLLGLYTLYVVLDKNKSRLDHAMIIALLLIITHLSHIRHLFYYMTALVLLMVITLKYYYLFKKNKQKTTKMLVYSFSIIAFSQILFFFMFRYRIFYAIAEIVQLIGFIGLLVTFIVVLNIGKKKKIR